MNESISQEVAALWRARDPIWHVQLSVLLAIILQLLLPDRFVVGPRYILPVLELILLVALSITNRRIHIVRDLIGKLNARFILFLIGISNIYGLAKLSQDLLNGGKINNGHALILAGMNIYLTNIIVFALLYWELDGGGPHKRRPGDTINRDFLFMQMSDTRFSPKNWLPTFIDYLALSGNTSLAFSPTDTMPLSQSAKLLMLIQALVALVVIGLVAARAVNILS